MKKEDKHRDAFEHRLRVRSVPGQSFLDQGNVVDHDEFRIREKRHHIPWGLLVHYL
jgi:hypothetical protein